jgi:hypothetical protein
MARIAGLDTGGTLFVDHHDPEWVTGSPPAASLTRRTP